jgi:peptidyl-prolyl cis-trans isomerase A (cyclophilin A)
MLGNEDAQSHPTRISIETADGNIVVEIFTDKAPITSHNFLRYVDEGLYHGATFYRSIRPDNGKRFPNYRIIQGGVDPTCLHPPLPPIALETTKVTGLSHVNGTLSAVPGPGSSEFFIVIGNTPELDFGGPYEEGFAAFGRVVEGIDVVCRINESRTGKATTIDYMTDQALLEPIPMRTARLPKPSQKGFQE